MQEETLLTEKAFQYLLHLFDTSTTQDIHEFLLHSKIHVKRDFSSGFSDAHEMVIIVDPEIFKKYQNDLREIKSSVSSKFYQFTKAPITKSDVYPDLTKFQILQNRIVPVNTPWQEINNDQSNLINFLRTATETIHYQNIGNASRTLLQKVSNFVFDPNKHKTSEKDVDLSEGKFKNRLHTYIRVELKGDENKEMRDYALSIITAAEKSIDLANKLTHELKASSLMAESCVISTISVISIIKLLQK